MPRRYNKEFVEKALEYASQGLTREQIAYNLGIDRATFFRWMQKHRDFSDAVKKGEELAISKVENALFKKALGYEYEEVKTYISYNKAGEVVRKREERTKKHVPPDTTAMIFFLKNRSPDRWSDRKDVNMSLDKVPKLIIELPGVDDDETEGDKK